MDASLRPEPVDLAWPDERSELLPFLPLIYVAWADGVLTDRELEAICTRISSQEWLDREARDDVQAWLQPSAPPSPASLERLRERVRALGPDPAGRTRRSLVGLGIELARADGLVEGPWSEGEALEALEDIERALGVVSHEAARMLVGEEAPLEARAERPGASFDVERMTRFLQEPHRELRQRVMALLAEPGFAFPHEIARDDYRERVLQAVRRLADEGLGALAFPEEVGGGGASGEALAAFETLGHGDLSVLVKYGVQFGLFGGSVFQLGTERHHEAYLEDIGALRLPGCFAMTEQDHGSNVRDLETEAIYDPETDELIVHTPHEGAGKHWIGNAARHGRMATVFAQLRVGDEDHGVHAVLVPIRGDDGAPLPGIRIADCGAKMGLNGVDNGQLWFHRVRVPRENLLDRFAGIDEDGRYHSAIPSAGRRFFTMLGTLVAGRISIAAASVSAARTGLTIALRYSAGRRQFGPSGEGEMPILGYLAHQRLLLPRLSATYGLHFATRELSREYAEHLGRTGPGSGSDSPGRIDEEAERTQRRIEVEAAALKAYASRHCVDTLQACREALGGQGYLAANRLGRLMADTEVFTTFEGANVVLLQLVSRGLLSRFGEEMGDLRLWDMVKYLADRAGTRVTELNPVVTRRTDADHLRDPDFHRAALEYREERLLASVARRLKRRIDDGMDSFDAMNECQDHLVALARAHAERRILQAFQEGVKRAPSPGLSEILRTLVVLWALERIEADGGWFQESGYVEGGKAKAIRRQVNALCGEVAEQALPLVEAFGIPDAVLRAPDGVRPPG